MCNLVRQNILVHTVSGLRQQKKNGRVIFLTTVQLAQYLLKKHEISHQDKNNSSCMMKFLADEHGS